MRKNQSKRFNMTHLGLSFIMVYIMQASRKSRIRFDCRAGYDGVSFNKWLISGADFTNQIISIE